MYEDSRYEREEGDINTSPARSEWQGRNLDAAARELLAEDERFFLRQALSTPCLSALSSATGSTLTDTAGREMLDFHGNSVHQLGYAHPAVLDAISQQLDKLAFCPRRFTNRPAVGLARKLAEITPGGLEKSLFAPSGAVIVGLAMKLARLATGRARFISFEGAFHGAGLDTISISGQEFFRAGLKPLLPGCVQVPAPDESQPEQTERSFATLECELTTGEPVAAVVAEPLRCTTVQVPPAWYWPAVRELCDRTGTLLVFDEIPLALGRTGALFACTHFTTTPDILCLGKGLGGGIWPLAALVARPELDIGSYTALGHYTHEKSPVGAVAALATLRIIADEQLCPRAVCLGEWLMGQLNRLATRQTAIRAVRGIGLALAVELDDSSGMLGERVMLACMERGLSFKVSAGNVLTLMPPLTLSDSEAERSIVILDASLRTVCGC